jgi:hypothetical protein
MTKTIVTETNYLSRNNQFKVVTNVRVVEDSGIRMTPQMMIHKKEVAHYGLQKEKLKTLKFIQHYQLIALKTDDDIESRQKQEYVSMILVPKLHRIEREMKVLEIQIEKLRARL